ncbi:hypothetical protein [Rhizohabitans arisaemae]|uniref:hypothetical protein n=1 Tax=Rhizohabitans arisaemae TaxID=2720610 RepID=UPI0024B15000|nr:hypothetical protein [Rhizohabitans arisaemae]
MSHPTMLARLTAERHWTYADAVQDFGRTAAGLGLKHTVSERQWARWCGGDLRSLPRPGCCRVLEHMFKVPVETLLRPTFAASAPQPMDEGAIRAAADESVEHLARIESATIGPATLEQLHDDVVRLARGYAATPPWEIFLQAVRARRRTYALLDQVRQPDQLRDLHLILGQLCGILASTSFDLGHEAEAERHARAAWGFGQHIGHNGLRAWARGTQALIAYWAGRPRDAVGLARAAQTYVRGGTGLVRAVCIEARAWSHLADRRNVELALSAAKKARDVDGDYDDCHDGVGGEFAFDPARQARCAGSAYLQLGDADAAINETAGALALYAESRHESLKVIPQAYVDLAAAHLLRRSLDGAQDALGKVLALPMGHRINGLIQRLETVGRLLGSEPYRDVKAALTLSEEIAEFIAAPVTPAITPRVRSGLPR